VRILLDTEVWLWALASPERLGREATGLLEDLRHPLSLSAASLWEIAIKYSLGKLELPGEPSKFVPSRLAEMSIGTLPIAGGHALRVADLPPHHGDPFDRLLVAQAQLERMPMLTADPQLLLYDVETIWAARDPAPRVRRRPSRRRR
jgi:PIN domain nuclease of toxin-antitoxin system